MAFGFQTSVLHFHFVHSDYATLVIFHKPSTLAYRRFCRFHSISQDRRPHLNSQFFHFPKAPRVARKATFGIQASQHGFSASTLHISAFQKQLSSRFSTVFNLKHHVVTHLLHASQHLLHASQHLWVDIAFLCLFIFHFSAYSSSQPYHS